MAEALCSDHDQGEGRAQDRSAGKRPRGDHDMTYAEARDPATSITCSSWKAIRPPQGRKGAWIESRQSVKRKRTTVTIRNTARPDKALVFIARLQTSRSRSKSIRRKIAAAERSVARLAPAERERLAHRIPMDIGNRPAPPQVLGGRPNTGAQRSEKPNLLAQRSG